MAEVIINIGANTGEANVAVENLNEALEQTGKSAVKATDASEELSKSLERQEARIKVIDGAINLLGGSVELTAAAIVGLGLASEEGAKEFEAAALGAIAFADGAKRTFDGVKSLNEGLKVYGGAAAAARKAQVALNAAVLANPWVALGAAVAAVGIALVAYYNAQVDAEEATKSGTAAIEAQIEADKKLKEETDRLRTALGEYVTTQGAAANAAEREVALAQAQGKSEKELSELRKKAIQERINDLNRQLGFASGNAELENEIREKLLDAENQYNIEIANFAQKRKDAEDKRRQDRFDKLNKENEDREERLRIHEENVTRIAKTAREQRLADAKFLADVEAEEDEKAFKAVLDGLQKQKEAGQTLRDEEQKILDARIAARDANFANLSATVGALGSLFAEGTAAAKAAAIADIAINIAQGYVNGLAIAQKSASATGPAAAFAFPLFYASQVAAVLAAANQARQILSTTPGGGSVPSGQPSRVGSPSFAGVGATPLGGGFQAGAPVVTPSEPLRAYVVTGDVVNGIQAQGQIRRRRTLGPG
jgi:hypothetical protein